MKARLLVAWTLEAIDFTIVIVWLVGFWHRLQLEGPVGSSKFQMSHYALVQGVMVAQLIWNWKCPLVLWSAKLRRRAGYPYRQPWIYQPVFTGLAAKVIGQRAANRTMSAAILIGSMFVFIDLIR